ncbi:hypothetical protein [Dactylosporangium matsuzakiense]|uniref:Uncharacterized protein n=1 Tax=Dactylosporangium matsuzakiense TaxID=53360 RepID=A0A9W6NQC6_9ACTN|nr:hypothetical protein [Dactylosporangium matsuzakiense]GLL04962.1 hypothetical protein GCM10017581_067090 [Dactylosporangium matsuzakiense]
MITEDADGELRRLARDSKFRHRDAARRGLRFRVGGDVADLVAIVDDPHPCAMTDVVFALAGATRSWLNWVPMPAEAVCLAANEIAARRAQGDQVEVGRLSLSAAEPATATLAARRVIGPVDLRIGAFPEPDIRVPLRRPARSSIWRYDGVRPVAAVPPPSAGAVAMLHQVGAETWPSMLSGYLQAAPLGELPLDDLLGLLAHLPDPPPTARWQHLARSTPTYWYRLLQPWVCLGLLHHAPDEPWPSSTRRQVLIDLAFGVEDWAADAALFALVTMAFRAPGHRREVRDLVRGRLDAAVGAGRVVTIEESLAHLMLVTPGCTASDHAKARTVLARHGVRPPQRRKRLSFG